MFRELPRYSVRYQPAVFKEGHHSRAKFPCIRRAFKKRVENDKVLKFLNVRHPFSRLLSAWRQKFDKEYLLKYLGSFKKYVVKIKMFEEKPIEPSYDHAVTLPAFLKYIASVSSDQYFNEHWRR